MDIVPESAATKDAPARKGDAVFLTPDMFMQRNDPYFKTNGFFERNIDHDVIMIPNEIHVMARYSSWMILFNAADVYFDRHLDKRSAPNP